MDIEEEGYIVIRHGDCIFTEEIDEVPTVEMSLTEDVLKKATDIIVKKITKSAKILVYSEQMYKDLNKYFDRDKTYTAEFPDIPVELMRHFIRGYFDGDGCFTFTDKTFDVDFLGASKNFHEGLKNVLSKNGFNFTTETKMNKCDTEMYYIHINRKKDKYDFLDWIYKDSNIYLDRKYEKYLKCKN